jgi:hypothetical protein
MLLLMPLLFAAPDRSQADTKTNAGAIRRGTVNIVLANSNGIVALTDSNETVTYANGESRTAGMGKKLFQIDARTICTIAGFGSTELANFPHINSATADMIETFTDQLMSARGPLTFDDKVRMLSFSLRFQLSVMGGLSNLDPKQLGDLLEVILAGYDLDSAPRISKLKFAATVDAEGVISIRPAEVTATNIGRKLAEEAAGLGETEVKFMLADPDFFAEDSEVGRYSKCRKLDGCASMTTGDMEDLAKDLALQCSAKFRQGTFMPIGGPNQFAILEKGGKIDFHQPTFPERPVNKTRLALLTDISIDCAGGSMTPVSANGGLLIIAVTQHYVNCPNIHLDGVYYSKSDFQNSTLHYAGGVFAFDPSNRVTNTTLLLHRGVDRTQTEVKNLIALPWKNVGTEP